MAQTPRPAAPPPSVTVDTVRDQDVAPRSEFIGRLEAIEAVDIKARVTGFIRKVQFQEGVDVKVGDVLFVIEDEQYQAGVIQAQSQVESADATLQNAELTLTRRKGLAATGATSKSDLDSAQAARDSAHAALLSAQAQLEIAKLNLSYTKITSPIAGRISKPALTEGNLVSPNSGTLARVNQLDPIRVVFSVSERDVITTLQNANAEDMTHAQVEAWFLPTIRLANGTEFDQKGKIVSFGNAVDMSTGTVPIRAVFDNPKGILFPGGTVFVSLRPVKAEVMPVVPVSAVQETKDGKYVLVVGSDNKVEERPIKTLTQVGQDWAVESGVKAGETIIVDGFQKVRTGAVVTPVRAQSAGKTP
jgi:membrane fusion protein (multidrug efflux system)